MANSDSIVEKFINQTVSVNESASFGFCTVDRNYLAIFLKVYKRYDEDIRRFKVVSADAFSSLCAFMKVRQLLNT